MKTTLLTLGSFALLATAHAAKPSEGAINACLMLKSTGSIKYSKLDTTEFQTEEAYKGIYLATLFSFHGCPIGYAAKSGKDDALIWRGQLIPLAKAKPLNAKPDEPSDFTPMLAKWGFVREGSQRFLCVNFNFDGLGQSGSFQRVHGLYMMSAPLTEKSKRDLFYAVRMVAQ